MNTGKNKDSWDNLSLKEKSEMMKAAVQQGIYDLSEIRKAYNEYAEGGPENNDNISLNNYLQQKRDSVVNAALSKSYSRNTPESIRFPITSSEKIMYTEAMNRALRNASKYYDGSSPIDTYSTEYQKMSEHLNDASYYSDLLENGTYGFNCINTATNNYGDSHQTYSNQMFYDNPEIYGFTRINNGIMKPGDIVQQTKYGKPTHAVMYVKDNERGEPLYNYSSGKDTPQDLRKERRYHFGKEAPLIYRFVGNRQDIADWTKEYEYKYGKKKALGGPLVQLANKYAEGGPYKPGTTYGRPTEEGLKIVSPEFDALLIGKVAANAAREAAGELLNSGIEGTARQRAAITSRRFGKEMAKRTDEVKGWSRTLLDDVKDGNYADIPLDLKGLTRNVWETGRYIKNTPERYVENTLPKFYRNVFRRTYNNTKPAIPMVFSDPENNE